MIPREHHENLYAVPPDIGHAVWDLVQQVAVAMRTAYACEGVSTRQHNEPAGDQDVWHLHVHVFPRHRDDSLYERNSEASWVGPEERAEYAETLAARDKQDALGARFSSWVWEEPRRASRLAERYNELFNSVVIPAHDGSHLSLPGLAESFRPHPHQRDAVARILTDGRALLAHAVGAGKTAIL